MRLAKATARASTRPKVRATGLLVEDGRILLVKQVLREQSHWNLPGGGLEVGETLEHCLVREMREETGLGVEVGELLYVCDRFKGLRDQVLDLSFLVTPCDGSVRAADREADGSVRVEAGGGVGDERLGAVRMVPFDQLKLYGFSSRFMLLLREGFPQKGSYQGDFHEFYG